jgi:hypothetical protein
MSRVEHALVAARIRRLIGNSRADDLSAVARDLAVSEPELRRAIDDIDPYPSLDVVIAVVRRYGVDPTWVMTGEYDLTRHRAALDDDDSPTTADIAKLISGAVSFGSVKPGPSGLKM